MLHKLRLWNQIHVIFTVLFYFGSEMLHELFFLSFQEKQVKKNSECKAHWKARDLFPTIPLLFQVRNSESKKIPYFKHPVCAIVGKWDRHNISETVINRLEKASFSFLKSSLKYLIFSCWSWCKGYNNNNNNNIDDNKQTFRSSKKTKALRKQWEKPSLCNINKKTKFEPFSGTEVVERCLTKLF